MQINNEAKKNIAFCFTENCLTCIYMHAECKQIKDNEKQTHIIMNFEFAVKSLTGMPRLV